MATASKTRLGFDVRCPFCGAADSIRLHADDLQALECNECNEDFNPDSIHRFLDQWRALLDWIRSAPVRP